MPNIFFVRHGESSANILRIFDNCSGDYPLTDLGLQQCEATATWFSQKPIQAIYSSPIPRALETARIISLKIKKPVTVLQELKEFRIGDLEGQPMSGPALETYFQVLQEWRNGNMEVAFPNGETYTELIKRFMVAINKISTENPDGDALVVGHGGQIIFGVKAICPQAEWETVWGKKIKNCSITQVEIKVENNKITGGLIKWADTDQLPAHLIITDRDY
jgi:broad specificity phosphatase PhoE